MVGLGTDDLLSDRLLAPHRVDRHHPDLDVGLLEDLGDRGDLVGFLGAELLTLGQAMLAGPGGDDAQWAEAVLGVVATSVRLAVEGDDRPLRTGEPVSGSVGSNPTSSASGSFGLPVALMGGST